jgi:hypothetical protein
LCSTSTPEKQMLGKLPTLWLRPGTREACKRGRCPILPAAWFGECSSGSLEYPRPGWGNAPQACSSTGCRAPAAVQTRPWPAYKWYMQPDRSTTSCPGATRPQCELNAVDIFGGRCGRNARSRAPVHVPPLPRTRPPLPRARPPPPAPAPFPFRRSTSGSEAPSVVLQLTGSWVLLLRSLCCDPGRRHHGGRCLP